MEVWLLSGGGFSVSVAVVVMWWSLVLAVVGMVFLLLRTFRINLMIRHDVMMFPNIRKIRLDVGLTFKLQN